MLLYELLAGTPPFHSDELKKAGLLEMLRVIREEEPPRPSTKLSTANKFAEHLRRSRHGAEEAAGLLRNELDWIVMKALEKDRARRYETVNGFAADVQRYLAGEAVQAHPPSAAYRLRKFARKNRVALTTAAAFAALLFAAVVVSSWLAVKARRAEAAAEEKRKEAEENALRADYNAGLANSNAGLAAGALLGANEWRVDAEQTALSLQVDIALTELKQDHRIGLLRLCRTRKEVAERLEQFKKLNTMTPADELVQPTQDLRDIRHGGGPRQGSGVRPAAAADHPRRASGCIRLAQPGQPDAAHVRRGFHRPTLGTRTARQIAILRKGDERVVNCGFSPDGRTVFTDDQKSVARFWDAPSGRFRAATEARPNRYDLPSNILPNNPDRSARSALLLNAGAALISGGRLITRSLDAIKQDEFTPYSRKGPLELWDMATGRLVARLDAPGRDIDSFQFLGERWVTTLEGGSTVLVFSAEDGRLLARLNHPAGEDIEQVDVGPSGRKVATLAWVGPDHSGVSFALRVWDTETWRAEPVTTPHCQPGVAFPILDG